MPIFKYNCPLDDFTVYILPILIYSLSFEIMRLSGDIFQ